MPELPEVETVKIAISKVLNGTILLDLYLGNKGLRWPFPKNIKKNLIGKKFGKPYRKGKY